MLEKILSNTKRCRPKVHCITNYVTVNDCANVILAAGGSAVMADAIQEVEEITAKCDALVLNTGTLNPARIEAMLAAGKTANRLGKPIILDPVGAGASSFRTSAVLTLLQELDITVLRCNSSEFFHIVQGTNTGSGVDAVDTGLDMKTMIQYAEALQPIVVITGETDIITVKGKAYLGRNGNPLMTKVTGIGCCLSALIGTYCGANPKQAVEACMTAVTVMGLAGELAYRPGIGTGSYRVGMMDAVSNMDAKTLNGGRKSEAFEG